MKEHICIVLCFHNYEHIVTCFENIYSPDIDYFVIENKSKYSDKISEYFLSKKLIGYLQFDENIADSAMKIGIQILRSLLKEYKYITLTDCDLEIADIGSTFREIKHILDLPHIGVCAIDLKMDNFPHDQAKPSDWIPAAICETEDYIEVATGGYLMTLKSENMDIITLPQFAVDGDFYRACTVQLGLKWVKTKINKAKHLTWDLYHKGLEYYNLRIENPNVFRQGKVCGYKKLV
jgi:hypothetical protein